MKSVEIPLPDELHAQLKIAAEQNNIALSDLLLALTSQALTQASVKQKEEEDLVEKLSLVQKQLQHLAQSLDEASIETIPDHIVKH